MRRGLTWHGCAFVWLVGDRPIAHALEHVDVDRGDVVALLVDLHHRAPSARCEIADGVGLGLGAWLVGASTTVTQNSTLPGIQD